MKLKTFACLAGLFLNLSPLSGQGPAKDPVRAWMNQIAQQQLQQSEDAIAAIHTVADAERRKATVHQKILESLGGSASNFGEG